MRESIGIVFSSSSVYVMMLQNEHKPYAHVPRFVFKIGSYAVNLK
jgi:hypothetical protein